MKIVVLFLAIVLAFPINAFDREAAIKSFKGKIAINPIIVESNPYKNPSTNADTSLVCAIQYADNTNHYQLKTFKSKDDALFNNYIVTHHGPCGLVRLSMMAGDFSIRFRQRPSELSANEQRSFHENYP